MAIEKQIIPYEFLARFDENGIKGMHVQNLEKVVDTDTSEVYAEKILGAQKVEEASAEYDAILSSINTAIQTENTSLKEENEALKAENEALKAENETLKSKIILLEIQLQN